MKALIVSIITSLTLIAVLLVGGKSLAYSPLGPACQDNPTATACQQANQTNDPITGNGGILMKTVNILAVIGGVVAVFIIMLAGIRFVTSGGDANKVSSAKNTILYTIVGIVVIVLARSIIAFVINKIG